MWKIKKIIKIIAIFLIIMFTFCVIFSIAMAFFNRNSLESTNIWSNTLGYLLYIIGYGDITSNLIMQNFFATIGIIAICLMSTFMTINLFWRIDDVKISKHMFLYKNKNDKYFGSILIYNMGADICRLSGSFIAYDNEGNVLVEGKNEFNYPLLIKKAFWKIEIPIENTFLFEILRNMRKWKINSKLYFTFSFVDTTTGQESIKVMEYTSDEIFTVEKDQFNNVTKKNQSWKGVHNLSISQLEEDLFNNWICGTSVNYPVKNLKPVQHRGKITLNYNTLHTLEINQLEQYIKANINFMQEEMDDSAFVMAFYDYNLSPLDWSSYYMEGGILQVELMNCTSIHSLTVEVKAGERKDKILDKTLKLANEKTIYSIPLNDMVVDDNEDRKLISNIKEICFTIFPKDVDDIRGEFNIYSCKIVLPE